jgi:hypothetical protein
MFRKLLAAAAFACLAAPSSSLYAQTVGIGDALQGPSQRLPEGSRANPEKLPAAASPSERTLQAGQGTTRVGDEPVPGSPGTDTSVRRPGVIVEGGARSGIGGIRAKSGTAPNVTDAIVADPGLVTMETELADCLVLANAQEMELLEFANGRLRSEAFIDLAKKMSLDHQQALDSLKAFSSSPQSTLPAPITTGTPVRSATTLVREARKVAISPDDRPAVDAAASATAMNSKMSVMNRAEAEECLALTKSALSQKRGPAFDIAFAAQQWSMHTHLLAKLRSMRSQVSPEFARVIENLEEKTRSHQMAMDDMLGRLTENIPARPIR